MRFEFGEGHFDRIEVGAVGRQEQEPTAVCLEQLSGFGAFVRCQVVEDDDGPWFQLQDQDFFDVGIERIAIHGARDNPRRHDPLARQARNQGLVAPPPEWGGPFEAQALGAPSIRAGHVRIGARLVDEDQPMGMILHGFLPPGPVKSGFSDRRLVALLGDQPFFYMSIRGDAEGHQFHSWNRPPHGPSGGQPAALPR